MERKIGEIFEHNGEWYQCVKDDYPFNCQKCCFYNGADKECSEELTGYCSSGYRSDGKEIIFKKLEKFGEPYEYFVQHRGIIMLQPYKLFTTPIINGVVCNVNYDTNTIDLEIKQTKEDMEENKLNLKPFDLEKSKAGKPVCTRDGRKARIICFDSKNDPQRPIVALVEHNDNELLYEYTIEGKERFSHISTTGTSDLMTPKTRL